MSKPFSRAFAGLLITTAAWTASAQTSVPLSVRDALTQYASGDALAISRISPSRVMVAGFTRELDAWIATHPLATEHRRRSIAAAFALETSWRATRGIFNEQREPRDTYGRITPNDPARWSLTTTYSQPIVARWVGDQLPRAGLTPEVEELFWLAACGLAQDASAWHHLLEDILPAARARLQAHPRLALAEVVARTGRDLGSLRRRSNVQVQPDLHDEHVPLGVRRRMPEAVRSFEALKTERTLAAEADLRAGYLELRREQWTEALIRLTSARESSADNLVRATSDYFAGWIHEQRKEPSDAIAAYRRANVLMPAMRSVANRLSALLFLDHRREEAYSVLDAALTVRPAPLDLLITFERVDARFVPEWLRSIREAVR